MQRKDTKKYLQYLRMNMSDDQKRANDLAQMKAGSTWLTSMPKKEENTYLTKREFFDGVALRYRWNLKYTPTICGCGKPFNVDHALSCMKGGYIHQRHDEMRDLIACIATEISSDVQTEPHLEELTGERFNGGVNEADEARLDLSIRGFWQRGQRAFFDIRIFNPFAQSHKCQSLDRVFKSNESEKKRRYGRRVIEVEHGSFSPVVLTPYGGCGKETSKVLSVLATRLSEKRSIERSLVTNWLNTKLSFVLLRSAILCIRGSRNCKKRYTNKEEIGDIGMNYNPKSF